MITHPSLYYIRDYNKGIWWYKPSFPDMQYEENEYLSHTSHSGSEISEWNIDGLAEGQIYSKLHEMGIAITAHKIKGSSDKLSLTHIYNSGI